MQIVYEKVYDVSEHQKLIDWEKVKAEGVDFVMLRIGYGKNNIDERWVDNASACARLGIPFGGYWFSYAYTAQMAEAEAGFAVAAISKYRLRCPISYDLEYDTVRYAAGKGVTITKALASAFADAFCARVQRAGFEAWNYSNLDYLKRMFDDSLALTYPLWYAQYNKTADRSGMVMWQHSSRGTVPGIRGNVDLNYAYCVIESVPRESQSDVIEAAVGVGVYSVSRDGGKTLMLDGEKTNFKVKEFACKDGTDTVKIDKRLLRLLQQLRDYYGPVVIKKGYRPEGESVAEYSTAGDMLHTSGQAADVQIAGVSPVRLAARAELLGVPGIGLYTDFVHLDLRMAPYYWISCGGIKSFGSANPYKKPAPGTILRSGSRGEDVKWLQTELKQEGYELAVDGIYGAATENAVKAYQARKGLSCDGRAGDVTMGRLAG